jgi:hypothetical protein
VQATAARWLLVLVVLAIGAATLRPSGDMVRGNIACVFCTMRAVADILSNMILFVPFGVAIALQRRRSFGIAIAAGALFSFLIEAAQYFLVPGRHANLGDFLANTAGVVVGYAFVRFRPWRFARQLEVRQSLLVALATVAFLLVGLTLLTQSFSFPTYYLRWTAEYAGHDRYGGKVLDTRLGPMQWQEARTMEPGDSVRELFKRFPLEARFVAGPPTRRLAPIVSVHDGAWREIIQIGAHGTDLVFRYWGVGDQVTLDHNDFRVERLFADVQPGDTVDFAFRFTRAGYCLRLNERSECGPGMSVAETWSLLISFDWSVPRTRTVGLLWLLLVCIPAGFVARDKRALLAVAALIAVGLAAGPLVFGFAPTRWYQIAAGLLGLLLGHMFAALFVRNRSEARPRD